MNTLEPKYRKGYTEFSSHLTHLRKWGFTDTKIAELTNVERSMISKLRTQLHGKVGFDEGTAIMKLYYAVASGQEPKLKSIQQMQSEHLATLAETN